MILFAQIMEQENTGLIIKSIRTRKGLTQMELADRVGTTQNHLSQIELGRAASSFEIAFKLTPLATPEEILALLSTPSSRRNNVRRMVMGATAILRALSIWPECPLEAKQLLKQFLPEWESFLDTHDRHHRF